MKKKAKPEPYFVVCIDNKGYETSLERGKLYRVVFDDDASSHGYVRIIDESGEDYGYAKSRFVEVPKTLENALKSQAPHGFVAGDSTQLS
jgi:hypothetical protein